MTMQIALHHAGWIVLAGDERHREMEDSTAGVQLSTPYQASKIKICEKHKIVISEAEDGYSSEDAADYLIEKMTSEDSLNSDFEVFLSRTMGEFFTLSSRVEGGMLILVNPFHSHPIWKIPIKKGSRFTKRKDAAIAGHENNSAIFWKEYLLNKIPNPTLGQLKMIAATVVLFAASINPSGIRGLEMWAWDGTLWKEQDTSSFQSQHDESEKSIMANFKP